MGFIEETLRPISFPKIAKIEQSFDNTQILDIEGYIRGHLFNLEGYQKILPGQSIAITAGSRSIHAIDVILRCIIDAVKQKGANPFIVPTMGSHGGATAEGQLEVLKTLNITEESMGVPIRSSMEVDEIGRIYDGRPVFLDRYANQADGIIVVNRIKAHTSFKGDYESGLLKMMAIGLGKQHGAQNYHMTGFKEMPNIIPAVGREVIRLKNILFGVGIVENSYGKVCKIEMLNPCDIAEEERKLLIEANERLPRLFFRQADVLIIKEIGKDISGTGMDSNVTGRFNNEHFKNDMTITKIGILDISYKTKGNANGVGMGDFITRRLYNKIDLDQTYPNALTSTTVVSVKIPMILDNDKMVIAAAIKTANLMDQRNVRLAIIESTKNMKILYVSENMLQEARQKGMAVVSDITEIPFDCDGNLLLDFR